MGERGGLEPEGDPEFGVASYRHDAEAHVAVPQPHLPVVQGEEVVRAEHREARPRIGTVVAGTTPAPSARRRPSPAPDPEQELNLDQIVRTAIDIADAEGLPALSMRGVAARLGVAAMSTYRYVPSKDDLILLMADTAFGEESYPADAPEEWRSRIELGARTLWTLYRRHPWLAQIGSLTRPLLVPSLMVHGEWMLGALDGHGLDPTKLFDIHVLLYSHVQGLAVHLEMEAHAEAATGQSEDQ